jgi:hypothetical protein
MKNEYKNFTVIPDGKTSVGRRWCRCTEHFKTDIREICCGLESYVQKSGAVSTVKKVMVP